MIRPAARFALRICLTVLLGGAPFAPVQADDAPPAVSGTMVGPALHVSDPARSARFYTDGLGMTVRMRFGPADRPDQLVGYGSDPAQPCIMLLGEKADAGRTIEHGHGFDRIAFQVPGLNRVSERLRAAGFQPGTIETAHGTMQVMMVTDPDGYRIELIDVAPKPARKEER
jgi:lactoylglutathione lyase